MRDTQPTTESRTMTTATQKTTYKVTISLETDFAPTSNNWVARDEQGHWRAHCEQSYAKTAGEAIAMMFHACEVQSVQIGVSEVSAQIYEY